MTHPTDINKRLHESSYNYQLSISLCVPPGTTNMHMLKNGFTLSSMNLLQDVPNMPCFLPVVQIFAFSIFHLEILIFVCVWFLLILRSRNRQTFFQRGFSWLSLWYRLPSVLPITRHFISVQTKLLFQLPMYMSIPLNGLAPCLSCVTCVYL